MILLKEYDDNDRQRLSDRLSSLDDREKGDLLSDMYCLGSNANAFFNDAHTLSAVELRKLDFLFQIKMGGSLIVMDEPINHMDITSIISFENALKETKASMILVSHDRIFRKSLCNKEYHLTRDGSTTTVSLVQ